MKEDEIGLKLRSKLHKIVGSVIMYHTRTYKIRGWRVKDGVVIIVADPDWIELVEKTAYKTIREEFLPAPDEDKPKTLVMIPQNGEMTNLKKILIENINRVQNDEKFVCQANAINKSVNAVINLAKLELSYYKTQNN